MLIRSALVGSSHVCVRDSLSEEVGGEIASLPLRQDIRANILKDEAIRVGKHTLVE